jgi:hypothetical protein
MAAGRKTGGRQKGAPNLKTRLSRETLDRLRIVGADPVDFLLNVMMHPDVPLPMRIDAAAKAAPFVRPKLQAVLHADASKERSPFEELLDELDGKTRGIPFCDSDQN